WKLGGLLRNQAVRRVCRAIYRGKRLSILAALDHAGFASWDCTDGTYTRNSFHKAFVEKILPLLNPWPLPRSIVVIDNAKIHMYRELEHVIYQTGARLIYLPPYSPQLNPIEVIFGLLKRWVQKNANLVFRLYTRLVLDVAMCSCFKPSKSSKRGGALNLYAHCGYDTMLRESEFKLSITDESNDEEY
ncbi:DDE superfamily endonuclease, partial [Phytophthora infestans]